MPNPAFRQFVEKWVHPDWRPVPVSTLELDLVEARLETYLPLSYREFMEQLGPASVGSDLLDEILRQSLDIPSFNEFFSPANVKSFTRSWRSMGLPEHMVAFASDGSGDLYCFEVVPESSPVPEDAIVWYFDHEELQIESLDIEFTNWIGLYAGIRKTAT